MKCDKCPGPDTSNYSTCCDNCLDELAKLLVMWRASGFHNSLTFTQFFNKVHGK